MGQHIIEATKEHFRCVLCGKEEEYVSQIPKECYDHHLPYAKAEIILDEDRWPRFEQICPKGCYWWHRLLPLVLWNADCPVADILAGFQAKCGMIERLQILTPENWRDFGQELRELLITGLKLDEAHPDGLQRLASKLTSIKSEAGET